MRRLIVIFLLLSCFVGLGYAQDLSESYTFVDGTSFSYPSNFLPFNEGYDRVSIADAQTELFVYVAFARTVEAQRLETLPLVLEYYFNDWDGYKIGDEEAITVGEHDAIRYEYDASTGRQIYIALELRENSSVVVVRIQPNTESGVEELSEEELALAIVASIHFEDIRGDLSTVLGNSFSFAAGLMIEHRDAWVADASAKSLSNADTSIILSAFTPEILAARNRKADPIEVLYYELFNPSDSAIAFNPNEIVFDTIRGREGIRYGFLDTVGEETVQRVYFVTTLNNGTIVGMSIQTRVGFNVLQDSDVQDMIQTLRPEGTLPPVTMMALGSSFNLNTAVVRFPDYWQARPAANGAASLSSLDVNVYLFGFSAADSADEGYSENLSQGLVEITSPFDESVRLDVEDAIEFTLENGNRAAQLTYTETEEDGLSYPRRVMLILLPDNSVVFVGIVPQPGVSELSAENEAEVRAIINTIQPR